MAVRKVRCPQCGEDALWAPENPDRPFCSSRCKQIDLGCWASDEYRIPVLPDDQDSSSEIPGATSHA